MQKDLLSADRVRTVITVIEQGSFSSAASKLGVSQPSVNQQVRRLEDELGRALFARTGRRLCLTADGEAYLVFARAMLDIGENARRYFGQSKAEALIRLGVAEEFTRTSLTRVLALFFRQFPDYGLELSCDSSARLLSDFAEGRYDIVLASAAGTVGDRKRLRFVRLQWIGSRAISLPILDPVPLVLPSLEEPPRDIALNALLKAGRTWRIFLQSSSISALEAAVDVGIGISVLASAIPLERCVALGADAGLPALTDHDIFMTSRVDGDAGMQAMRAIIDSVFSQLDPLDFPLQRL